MSHADNVKFYHLKVAYVILNLLSDRVQTFI